MAMTEEHRNRLRRNQVRLTDDLEVSEELLAVLMQEKILTTNTKDEIDAEPLRKKKAQNLLFNLPRRGKNAFEAFIKALCESGQGELAKELDEELYRKHRTASDIEEDDILEISPPEDVIKKILLKVEDEQFMVQVTPMATDKKQNSKPPNYAYSISQPCGRALIIGIENRDKNLGIKHDVQLLSSLFQQLNFEAVIKLDLTSSEMLSCVKEEAQNQAHSACSAFVLCIINYGSRSDEIFDSDGNPIKVENFLKLFDGSNCSSLRDKPKLYFIHTGDPDGITQHPEQPMETDQCDMVDGTLSSHAPRQSDDLVVHEKGDVLQIVSTSDVWRHESKGSWFVRCLASLVAFNARNQDLEEMIFTLNSIIELKESKGQRLQRLRKKTTLRKKFYLVSTM